MDAAAYRWNKEVMILDPKKNPEMDPKINHGYTRLLYKLRYELDILNIVRKKERQEKLRQLMVRDFEEQGELLRKIGLALFYTQL